MRSSELGGAFFICANNVGKEETHMQEPDYKELYFELFNRLTDIIEEIKTIQKNAEEQYISGK